MRDLIAGGMAVNRLKVNHLGHAKQLLNGRFQVELVPRGVGSWFAGATG